MVASRIAVAVEGKPSLLAEAESQGAVVLLRALPLRPRLEPSGALVLLRDVTELKRRDLALLSKDATIREIHHRVKNNLQTVAALLRLQARRTGNDEAKRVLRESVRRVNSIAVVHETLSMSVDEQVDLDGLVDKVIPMIGDVATAETRVSVHREGAFGVLAGALATPLVLVLTELVHNALAHAYAPGQHGEIVISADQQDGALTVLVHDDGWGLPAGFDLDASTGLGLQIVRTLVDSELHATLSLAPGPTAAPWLGWSSRCTRRPRLTESAEAAGRAAGHLSGSGGPRWLRKRRARQAPVRARARVCSRFSCSPLVFAHATPYAGVLAAVQRPGQAVGHDWTATADGLGLGDLQQRRTRRANRKEQLRVLVAADSAVAPIHDCCTPRHARSGSRWLSLVSDACE